MKNINGGRKMEVVNKGGNRDRRREMRNIRFIVFIGITIMIIGILTALIIPIASFTTGGIAALISTTLFVIYLIIIEKKS